MKNEVLAKTLCHNICVLIRSIYEDGLAVDFFKKTEDAADDAHYRSIGQNPGSSWLPGFPFCHRRLARPSPKPCAIRPIGLNKYHRWDEGFCPSMPRRGVTRGGATIFRVRPPARARAEQEAGYPSAAYFLKSCTTATITCTAASAIIAASMGSFI